MAAKRISTRVSRTPTPAELTAIARGRIAGASWRSIAAKIGADPSTVALWFREHIEPVWKGMIGRRAHEELAKLNELERECWLKYEATADGEAPAAKIAWLSTIIGIIELRARLRGYFAPKRSALAVDVTFRVAGSTPGQVNEEMVKRLFDKIEERRRYEQALRAADGSAN